MKHPPLPFDAGSVSFVHRDPAASAPSPTIAQVYPQVQIKAGGQDWVAREEGSRLRMGAAWVDLRGGMAQNRIPVSEWKSDSTRDPRMVDERPQSKSPYSRWDRLKFWAASYLGYCVINLTGRTLRWQVEGWEHWQSIKDKGENLIYAFWHGRIFMATFFFRKRGIVVMTSQNRDGEYIAGVIGRFGYGAARGSSTRGGRGALVEMVRALRKAKDVAFTIDGPKGPRYVAKPGAVWIASKSGVPVLPFNISVERKWVLNSWDRFHIPWPFSRAYLLIGSPIYVEKNGSEEALELAQRRLQVELEELLARGDARYGRDEWKSDSRKGIRD